MGGCLLDLICEASRIVLKLIGVLRSGRFSTYHYKQCMLYYYKRDTLTKSALRYSKQFKLRLLMTKMKSYICKSPMRKKLGGDSCRPLSLREDLEYRVNWNFTQLRNRESKLKKDFRFGGMGGSIHYLQLVLVIYAQLVTIDKKSFLAPLTLLLKTSLKFKVLNTHNFIPLPSPLGTCLNIALITSMDLYNIH